MFQVIKNIYDFFENIPDRLYPFTCEIEGRLVRGRKSYLNALGSALNTYGPSHIGYKLTMYRAVFHFIGSVLFIIFATLLSQKLFGSELALYILLGSAIIAIFYQEFYSHPKRYGQSKQKGVIDWLTWAVPMVVYISINI